MQTLHVQQRCVPPPFDIYRSIDVGVVRVATTDAGEARLALAAPCINDTARGAGLARKSGQNGHDLTASFFHLVGEDRRELVPACVEDDTVESGLLADIFSGIGNCAFRTRGHSASVQVFEHSDAEALRDIERSSVMEVATDAGLPSLEAGDAGLCSTPAVRPALASSGDALRLPLADLDPLHARRHGQHLTRGEGQRGRYASINANDAGIGGGGFVRYLARKRDLVAALKQCRDELGSIHYAGDDVDHAEKHSAGFRLANAALAKVTTPD